MFTYIQIHMCVFQAAPIISFYNTQSETEIANLDSARFLDIAMGWVCFGFAAICKLQLNIEE